MLWILGVVCLIFLIGFLTERHDWNKGRCPKCWASHWIYFDTDSQGGRGYKCSVDRSHTTWISYPFIDPPVQQSYDDLLETTAPQAWRGRITKRNPRKKKKRS
jgi:hypothetical protein